MAGSTLTLADSALKEYYLPTVRDQLNNSNMLLQQIESNSTDVEGRRAVLSLHVRRNSGVGARAEGGALPTAGYQKYAEERVDLRHNYARIQITGPQMRAMKSDKGSYVRAVDSEMKGAVKDIKRDVNRQLWGTSDGVIAACGVTTTSTTVVLATATTTVQMRQLEVGMLIDIGTGTTMTDIATARAIVSVDTSAKTIVISGAAVSTDANDRIVRSGSGGGSTYQVELTGVQSIVAATGALFNVDPATEPVWASTVLSNSGTNRAATETLFAQAVQQASIFGGEEVDLFVCSDGVHRNFAAQLLAQKRFAGTIELKGGYKALSITAGGDEKALTWDRDCPNNAAFGFSTSHLTQHQQSDWDWADDDGAVLSRVSGYDAYEAFMYKDHELTSDQRNSHVKVADLSES